MYIRSMFIKNIKSFDRLDLKFSERSPGDYSGFNVFVGGNASGKSTLLKCIAMASAGINSTIQLLTPNLSGWVKHGINQGSIRLDILRDLEVDHFEGSLKRSEQIEPEISFDSKGGIHHISVPENKRGLSPERLAVENGTWANGSGGWFLAAYGPLRRLTGSSRDAESYDEAREKVASCVTLFREDAALSGSEAWLQHEYARKLEQISQNIVPSDIVDQVKQLLNDGLLPDGFRISRITVDEVLMETPTGAELPMSLLSDGCRCAYALILDIVRRMATVYGATGLIEVDGSGRAVINKPGVILIDEIESHLHPTWQRTLCEWLKTRFPAVQFFVGTHSPLIVQAADAGGIFVLPLPGEIASGQSVRKLTHDEEQRVLLGDADAVLLGRAFGLEQTWSVRAERLVREYETLSAIRHSRGNLEPDEKHQYDLLTKQLQVVFNRVVGAD